MSDDIESVLRRRGHHIISTGRTDDILLPVENRLDTRQRRSDPAQHRSDHDGVLETYLSNFSKSSFRKLASMLIAAHGEWVDSASLRKPAGNSAFKYLQFLNSLNVIEVTPDWGQARLTRPLSNLGPSLEHYVASEFERELSGSAEWGVHLEGLPQAGGDYDVLAWLDPTLVYVECKSGKPSGIGDDSLAHFLQRTKELAPDLAILLLDVDVPIDDFVRSRLNQVILRALGSAEYDNILIRSIGDDYTGAYPGVWFGLGRIYVTNSQPNILRQLRRCLQYFHANAKQRHFYIPLSVNYLKAL